MELTKKMEKIMNDLIGERMEEVFYEPDAETLLAERIC